MADAIDLDVIDARPTAASRLDFLYRINRIYLCPPRLGCISKGSAVKVDATLLCWRGVNDRLSMYPPRSKLGRFARRMDGIKDVPRHDHLSS